MVVVGGITRLTLSGLSITEWHPVIGIIPPLTHAQWAAEFARYQQVPEYRAVHYGMSLDDFKTIFFWEYSHRLLGRLIGIAFAVPLVWFWVRGRLPRGLAPVLLAILALGGAQGLLGWYMVESGLVHRVEVSQYRLVAHLALALAIYSLILWTALGLAFPMRSFVRKREQLALNVGQAERDGTDFSLARHPHPALLSQPTGKEDKNRTAAVYHPQPIPPLWRRAAEALIVLVGLTIAAGGFVAGTRAGLTYNTFPLMDGRMVPAGYDLLHPFVRNWFENIPAIQFDHRLLAETTFAFVMALGVTTLRSALPRPSRIALGALFAAVLVQVTLGISTLLLVVPVPLAAAHQAGAVVLLTAAIVFRHSLRPRIGAEVPQA